MKQIVKAVTKCGDTYANHVHRAFRNHDYFGPDWKESSVMGRASIKSTKRRIILATALEKTGRDITNMVY